MKIDRTEYGTLMVLAPRGELSGEGIESLQSEIRQCENAGASALIIDCHHIGSADSAGLELLVDIADRCIEESEPLRLCGVHGSFRTVLEITRLIGHFELHDDVEAAIRSAT